MADTTETLLGPPLVREPAQIRECSPRLFIQWSRQYLDVRLVRLNRSSGKSSMPEVDGVGTIGIFGQHRLSTTSIAMEVQR